MFRALLIACCLTSFPALADGGAAIGELVNQRLSLMKDVAGYKAQQHLPIEDLAQEAKVLANAQAEAGRLGLEPASVRPFITAQMDAAKAIMTTDTFPKVTTATADFDGVPVTVVGIAKGAAMIGPNMGTMLGFVDHHALEAFLAIATLIAFAHGMTAPRATTGAIAGVALGCYLLAWGSGAFLIAVFGIFVVLFVALETVSIPAFAMVALRKRDLYSSESAIEFFLIGVLSIAEGFVRTLRREAAAEHASDRGQVVQRDRSVALRQPVTIRALTVHVPGAYGIRAVDGVNLTVERTTILAINPPQGRSWLLFVSNDALARAQRAP